MFQETNRIRVMFVRALLTASALLCPLALDTAHASGGNLTVVVETGPLRGIDTDFGRAFLGIPYAAPPVGNLRWKPPAPAAHWHGLFDATALGNNCPQAATPFGLASTTEDCLVLNVYTPPASDSRGHANNPVMVFIHPGAFQFGEGGDYEPAALVQRGVVVITINYRLGALGWLAHPALTAESPNAISGNYGLMDQQAALGWVKRNIDRFGGDPSNVTIFGESAGGVSVHAHLASPQSAGLFTRAIAESGSYSVTQPTLAAASAQGTAYATAVGCASQDAACLRAVPVATLLAHQSTSPTAYLPVVDGQTLPLSIGAAFATGQFNRVPVIEGTTHDEFRLFVASLFELQGIPINAATYPSLIAAELALPPPVAAVVVPLVIAQYPLANYPSAAVALGAIGTDAAFACNMFALASSLVRYTPTWGYEFNDPNAPMSTLPPVSFPYGAYHTSELQYLFNVRPNFPAPALNAAQQQLADAMQSYWTQLAAGGDPNGGSAPAWPAFQAFGAFQRLAPPTPAPFSSLAFLADHKCAFWASLGGS